MANITNDVYGQNMQRKDAEPKITPKRKRGWFGQNRVEQQVMGKDDSNSLTQTNEELHAKQRKTQ